MNAGAIPAGGFANAGATVCGSSGKADFYRTKQQCASAVKRGERWKMRKSIKDIENHLERYDARFEGNAKIEAIRQKNRLWLIVIKLNVGIISILCAVYAVYMQF